jgi:hypothetical protein
MMRLWEQLGGARPGGPSDDEWLSQYAETTTWWHRYRRGRQGPNHATPYLDVVLPPCAAICLFISMYAVLGIGMVELPRVRGHLNAYEPQARDGSSCATHSSAVPAGVPR